MTKYMTTLKDIVDAVNDESATDRTRITLYMSRKAFESFRACCGQASASRVMETFIKAYTAEQTTRKRTARKETA